jgi:hypothetical protein
MAIAAAIAGAIAGGVAMAAARAKAMLCSWNPAMDEEPTPTSPVVIQNSDNQNPTASDI